MFVDFSIDDGAAVKDGGVFVEFPTQEVVSFSDVLGAADLACEEGGAAAAEVVMKGVGEADGFVFVKLPAGVVATDVVGDIASEETVFAFLDFLFESVAVVGKFGLIVGVSKWKGGKAKDARN